MGREWGAVGCDSEDIVGPSPSDTINLVVPPLGCFSSELAVPVGCSAFRWFGVVFTKGISKGAADCCLWMLLMFPSSYGVCSQLGFVIAYDHA